MNTYARITTTDGDFNETCSTIEADTLVAHDLITLDGTGAAGEQLYTVDEENAGVVAQYLSESRRSLSRRAPPLTIKPGVYRLDVYRGGEDIPERGGRFRVLPSGIAQFDDDGYWCNYFPADQSARSEPAAWDTIRGFTAHGRKVEFIGAMLAVDACNLDYDEPEHRPFNPRVDRVVVSFIGGLEMCHPDDCEMRCD
jgi:hypothetical protein